MKVIPSYNLMKKDNPLAIMKTEILINVQFFNTALSLNNLYVDIAPKISLYNNLFCAYCFPHSHSYFFVAILKKS